MRNLLNATKKIINESFMPDEEFISQVELALTELKTKKITVEDFIDGVYDIYYESEIKDEPTTEKSWDWSKSLVTDKKPSVPQPQSFGKPGQIPDAT